MYEHITYESILQRMLDRVSNQLDKREGSVIYDTHSPTAIELQILYLELDTILREAYGDTASREFLILRCKERGINPFKATKALLKGRFTPDSVPVIGQRFTIDNLYFVVTEQLTDGEYKVQCEEDGIIGNQYLGTMIPVHYMKGLETAELIEVLIPGEEEEGTEELRTRYFDSFHSQAFGGNQKDYTEKANAIPGVGCTKVTPVWNRSISPHSMIPSTEVINWYHENLNALQTEVANWLTPVFTAALEKKLTTGGTVKLTILDSYYNQASETLIQAVQEVIDPQDLEGEGMGIAPIGHVVHVGTAEEVKIQIKTMFSFESGYSWSNLQTSMEDAVKSYLLELRKTWADNNNLIVRISQLETRLLAIPGIVDIMNTSINGLEENLTLDSFQIPVFGGINEWLET